MFYYLCLCVRACVCVWRWRQSKLYHGVCGGQRPVLWSHFSPFFFADFQRLNSGHQALPSSVHFKPSKLFCDIFFNYYYYTHTHTHSHQNLHMINRKIFINIYFLYKIIYKNKIYGIQHIKYITYLHIIKEIYVCVYICIESHTHIYICESHIYMYRISCCLGTIICNWFS